MALLSPNSPAPPELEFFRLASRVEVSPGQAAELQRLIQQGLAWDRLMAATRKHGVAGLWHRHARSAWYPMLPQNLQDECAAAAAAQTRQNLLGLALLKELHPLLSPEFVCLKGPLLAQSVYGDLTSRPSQDLDCWVPLSEVVRVEQALRAQGWAPQIELHPEQEQWLRQREYARAWFRSSDGAQLDLHWHWVPEGYSFYAEPELFSKRRRLSRLGQLAVPVLDAETHLNFLLWHGAKHNWERWMLLVDVAEWLHRHPSLEWARMETQAAAFGGRTIFYWGLGLAAALLDAPVPEVVLESTRQNACASELIEAATKSLGRLEDSSISRMDVLFRRALEQPADRQRHVWRLVFEPTPMEWKMMRLRGVLTPLYYVLRGLRNLASPIRRVFK